MHCKKRLNGTTNNVAKLNLKEYKLVTHLSTLSCASRYLETEKYQGYKANDFYSSLKWAVSTPFKNSDIRACDAQHYTSIKFT